MIVRKARRHGGQACYYSRVQKSKTRMYHAFGLCRVVAKDGSYWRLIVGRWAIAFGFRAAKGE